MTRKRVLLLLPDLAGGGAERTTLNLQRYLDSARYEVMIGLLEARGDYLPSVAPELWTVPQNRTLRALARLCPPDSMLRGMLQVPLLASLLRTYRPDIVMSSMADVTLPLSFAWHFLPGLRRRTRWIAREGNHTEAVLVEAYPSAFWRRAMARLISRGYGAADVVLTPCRGVADGLVTHFAIPRAKLTVVGNPLDLTSIESAALETPAIPLPGSYIVAVGRLQPQKGFDLLIRAFAALNRPDLSLVILGEGPERNALATLAQEFGVGARLHLPGFLTNPWPVVARAELFCLSSRWEGFGHVVIEAMACGAPVVVTSCPHGPAEIVRDGVDGIVVRSDDWEALRDGIASTLEDKDGRRNRVINARLRAHTFAAPLIAEQYGAVFDGPSALPQSTSS